MDVQRQRDQDWSPRRSRLGRWGTPAQAVPSPAGTVLQALNALGRAGASSRVQRQPRDCQGGQSMVRHGKPINKPGSAGDHLGTGTDVM